MEEYEDSGSEQKLSKINSGVLITLRLDSLWKDANRHARSGQYSKWNADLDRVWCELAGDEKEDSFSKFNELNVKLSKLGALSSGNLQQGFSKINDKTRIILTRQYYVLMDKEIFLRQVQNKQGKGSAYDRGEDDYMD